DFRKKIRTTIRSAKRTRVETAKSSWRSITLSGTPAFLAISSPKSPATVAASPPTQPRINSQKPALLKSSQPVRNEAKSNNTDANSRAIGKWTNIGWIGWFILSPPFVRTTDGWPTQTDPAPLLKDHGRRSAIPPLPAPDSGWPRTNYRSEPAPRRRLF